MRNLIALELSKHRKNFRSICLLLAISMVVFLIGFLVSGNLPLSESIRYTVEFAFIASAFLLPLYFGVATGNALRHEPEKSSEDLLPTSPLKRAWAAYAVGLLYTGALGLAVAIVFMLTQFGKPSFHLEIDAIEIFLFGVLYFHMICFLFGYLVRQSIVASGAAILAFVLNSSCFSMLQTWRVSWMVEYGLGYDSWNWTSAVWLGFSVLALAIPTFSVVFLVRRIQRGIDSSFGVVLVTLLLVLLPLLIMFVTFFRAVKNV